jgi:hypothetical protein
VILEGIRQQQEAQRQQMLQHQMMTSQMFTFMYGCLGQLFQQSGIQLPQPPTTAQLQADPTAPLPPAGGFVNVPIVTFPQSPLLQTGMFAVPQMTTPQAAVTSSFQDQLQMTTPCAMPCLRLPVEEEGSPFFRSSWQASHCSLVK